MLDALGHADIEHQVPTDDESIFSLISMTKAFIAVAVMRLVEDSKRELSEPYPHISRPAHILAASVGSSTRHLHLRSAGNLDDSREFFYGLIGDGGEQDAWEAVYQLRM